MSVSRGIWEGDIHGTDGSSGCKRVELRSVEIQLWRVEESPSHGWLMTLRRNYCLAAKSCLTLLLTQQTVAHQAPLSMGFPRYTFPSPGDIPDPGIEPKSLAWQVDSSPLSHLGSPALMKTKCHSEWGAPMVGTDRGLQIPSNPTHWQWWSHPGCHCGYHITLNYLTDPRMTPYSSLYSHY